MCVFITDLDFWNHGFHDHVGIRKALRRCQYVELGSYFLFLQEQIKDIIIIIARCDGRDGGHHRSSPNYFYNADGAGLVSGAGYPECNWSGGLL